VPKRFVGLCLAALLAGLTGFAPYAAGQCALRSDAMPGMASHGGMPSHDGMAMGAGHDATSGHAPAAAHRHGCCGCLGPCAGAGPAALPATSTALLVGPRTARPAAPAALRIPDLPQTRLLPFANGPPSLLG
jgi:hypothetical protein